MVVVVIVISLHAVKPKPVSALEVTSTTSKTTNITWLPPTDDEHKHLFYEIVSTSLQGYEPDQVCKLQFHANCLLLSNFQCLFCCLIFWSYSVLISGTPKLPQVNFLDLLEQLSAISVS